MTLVRRSRLPAAFRTLLEHRNWAALWVVGAWLLLGPLGQVCIAQAPQPVPKANSLGPLRISPTNSRYFMDPQGHTVYLAGSHTWNNLVDIGSAYPPKPFDYAAYLDYLQAQGHNVFRLWAWEIPWRHDRHYDPGGYSAAPQPWLRTGPGLDFGGQPRFDLTRLNPEYFHRLRARVQAARERHIYVIVMLFEAHMAQITPTRTSHPFFATNNINQMEFLTDVEDIYTLKYPRVTELQQQYVRAVVDSVNDLDNVLFEVANEGGPYSVEWQRAMLRYVRTYEAGKPFQHPVGLTFPNRGENAAMLASDADWISPGTDSGHYATAPEPASGSKVILADTDHLGGASFDDALWPWHSLFRGLNVLYMDNYVGPDSVGFKPTRAAVEIRTAIGMARLLADSVDLVHFVPKGELASTGYCLTGDAAVLVFTPDAKPFSLDLRGLAGAAPHGWQGEWLETASGRVAAGDTIHASEMVMLESPFPEGAVLYLRASGSALPTLIRISGRAMAVHEAAHALAPWSLRWELSLIPFLRPVAASYVELTLALAVAFLVGALAVGVICLLVLRGIRQKRQLDT